MVSTLSWRGIRAESGPEREKDRGVVMEDQKVFAYVSTLFFLVLAFVPWLAVGFRAATRARRAGTHSAAATLAMDGLITGLTSYFLLFALTVLVAGVGIYQPGRPGSVAPMIAVATSFNLVETALKASASLAYTLFAVACISGLSASVTAVLSAAALALIHHLRKQAEE